MKSFIFCTIAALVLLSGCATRLGYPVEQVKMPTEVTVRYDILNEEPVINIYLDTVMTGVWKSLYGKRITNQLNELDRELFFQLVGSALEQRLPKYPKLFTPKGEIKQVQTTANIPKKSEKKYSGYNFSSGDDTIDTPYVLMYQLVNYGYMVSDGRNGAILTYSILLIDAKTNQTLWKTGKELFKKVPFSWKGPHDSVMAETLAVLFEELITESVDDVMIDLTE